MIANRTGPRARVVVVGEEPAAGECARALVEGGYDAERAGTLGTGLVGEGVEAIVLARDEQGRNLERVRALRSRAAVPLLVLCDGLGGAPDLREAGADSVVCAHAPGELAARLEAVIRNRRFADRELIYRARLRALADVTQATNSTITLEQALHDAADRVGELAPADRCSVLLLEPTRSQLTMVASREQPCGARMVLELARYPELRRALATRETVVVYDALDDPLMEEVRARIAPLDVRSILVQPLIAHDELLGALFLRMRGHAALYGPEEVEFVRAAGAGIAAIVRASRMRSSVVRKREELESAYVDRYRELVEANARLKELNRFKDEVLAICSHDLRGPLNVLLGHARLLADGDLDRQETASVQAITRQGRKLLDLVESLLDKARGDSGRLSLEPVEVDLAAACRELASELEILGAERGVSIEVQAPQRLGLLADRVKVREVLQNLLGYAIRRARDGGNVRLVTERIERPDGPVARVEVRHDGAGIPDPEIPQLFDRYRRNQDGASLGLAIARDLVELHGGEIWAERGQSEGGQLVFTLPLTDAKLPRCGLDPNNGPKPRVLVVEDEPDLAAITAEMLRVRYRVDVARDGAEALAKARALSPDLMVMDVFLPRVDGLDALATLKAAPDTRHIPVILVSAHRGVADKVRALDLGAADYLAKPFQAAELLLRVEAVLSTANPAAGQGTSRPDDGDTGLLARDGFLARLAQEQLRARRYGRALSLVLFHPRTPVGTEGLAHGAALLRSGLRTGDVLGHLGAGEFAACLPEAVPAAARATCVRLLEPLARALGASYSMEVVDASGPAAPEQMIPAAPTRVAPR